MPQPWGTMDAIDTSCQTCHSKCNCNALALNTDQTWNSFLLLLFNGESTAGSTCGLSWTSTSSSPVSKPTASSGTRARRWTPTPTTDGSTQSTLPTPGSTTTTTTSTTCPSDNQSYDAITNATTGKQRCRECCTHYSTSRSSATASADHYSNAFNYWSPGHLNRRHGPDVPTPTPGFGVSTSSTSPTSTSGHPQSTHPTTSTTTHGTNCTSCLYTTTSHSRGYFHCIHSSWTSSHITPQISEYHTSSPQIHPQITHKIS